ncbi:MAG: OB-fold domain-containing protein [Hyphomicrobiaceae bacterium]|nr:OB-fold domain-containing protein [Hyphomicrobiaceae bacterium]
MSLPFIDVASVRPWPPRISAFTKPFWDALGEGRLMTTRGRTSGRLTFPPKPFCPHSWEREIEWVELSGRGKLYTHTLIHATPAAFIGEAPIRNGIVDLDEGLRVAARIMGEPGLDSSVECVVLRYTDGPLFAFRAADLLT